MKSISLTLFAILIINFQSYADIVFSKSNSPYHITEDYIVDNHESIIIQAGATIIISPGVNIITNGTININGTEEDSVFILPETPGIGWGQIKITSPNSTSVFSYLKLIDGSILSWYCNMIIDNVKFINNQNLPWNSPIMFIREASVNITKSAIYGDRGRRVFKC